MKSPRLLGRPLAVVLVLSMVLAAAFPVAALARDTSGDDLVVNTGPTLWQVKDAPAYNPVARDLGDTWRSVRMPPADQVEKILKDGGAIPLDASPEEIETAISQWSQKARKDAYIGPDPLAFRKLEAREQAVLNNDALPEDWELPTPPKSLMAVTVNFDGTDTITRPYPDPNNPGGACVDTEFTWGPLDFGDDPPPGPRDNFEFFKDTFTVEEYEEAFFGEGPDAGYDPFVHPVLGLVDLSGSTLQNYLLEHSRDLEYRAGGAVLSTTVTLTHTHEYYGYARYDDDGGVGPCTSPTFSDANYRDFAPDVIEAVKTEFADTLDCSMFDADGDMEIDVFVMIHAGRAYQNGGGDDRLSTSSSALQTPLQICGHSTPADPSDDYYVRGYNVDPEQLDVGAIQEEFEHQFGLPDLYSTDGNENSNGWWGAHSSGVWGGPLGGTRPVGHNLWQDFVLGWRDPVIVNYDDPELEVTIGRARYKPEGTEDGLIVMLPDKETSIDNLAGTGIGWYSTAGDMMDNRVYREWDLSGATGQAIFSFDAYWDIEEDWDYGFFEVSTDGGATWTTLPDMDGILRDTNPNGNNRGWGLTGQGQANLRFDISSAVGLSSVWTRISYVTDPAVANPGFWVDNISVDDASGNLYFNDLETNFSDWTVEGWIVVPFTQISEQYYLFEWRDDNGFDQSLNDAYHFYYNAPDEGIVDRLAYSTPGMTVTYRDMSRDFDYEIGSDIGDSPSYGPKHALIVVESHFFPKRFDTLFPNVSGGYVGPTPTSRALPGDAAFGHSLTEEWTAHLGYDYNIGQYVDPPLEMKTWPGEPGVPAFHDSYGYYPGFFYPGEGNSVYFTDFDASAAVPAQGDYTTKITWPDFTPLPDLYGVPIGPAGLGTGNPGDNHVQYGIHVEVTEQSDEQATIRFWNALNDFDGGVTQTASTNPAVLGTYLDVMVNATNIGGALADGLFMVPVDPDTVYVPGSAYGGAYPLTAAYAAQLAAEKGLTDLANLAAEAMPEDVVAVAWAGEVPTGFNVDFGFATQITNAPATVQYTAAIFDGATLIGSLDGETVDVVDNSTYPVDRSMRFNVDRDNYINGTQPSMYYGSDQTMWVGFYDQMRPVVHTPLNGIPGDSPVDQAWLYLYVTEGRKFGNWSTSVLENVTAHPATTEWMPYAVNWWMPWTMPGGDYGPGGVPNHLGSGKIGTWLRLDITAAVQDMLRSGLNQGFLIMSDVNPSGVHYGLATKEYWDPSKLGYIRVYYRTAN